MAAFGKSACLWHAFTALEDQSRGEVLKSQLKVLTHNVATCLGIYDVQQLLNDDFFQSIDAGSVAFKSFLSFLKQSLFVRLSEAEVSNGNVNLSRVDEVCWFVCAPYYLNNRMALAAVEDGGKSRKLLTESNAFKLWCVFNVLAEVEPSSPNSAIEDADEIVFPVRMDWEEVLVLVQRIFRLIGQEFSKENWRRLLESMNSLSYIQFINLIETRCVADLDDTLVSTVVNELYEEYILGVLKKGYLSKKGPRMLSWNERWCVLTPTFLTYYTNRDEKEKKGVIAITYTVAVEEHPDGLMQKPNRFTVLTPSRDYEFSAIDTRTKSEWMAAVKQAVKLQSAAQTALSKSEIRQRRISRFARREKMSQEQLRQRLEMEEKERALRDLEEERQKRAEMEAKWKAEELRRQSEREEMERELEGAKQACVNAMAKYAEKDAQYEFEKQRLAELEEIQRNLQILLEKERMAREAESSARTMQESALREEMEKKKKMEDMQAALQILLLDEKHKREDLEEVKSRQEALLLEEKRLLQQLERERCLRNKEYEEALFKLREAELEKEEMKKQLEKKKVFISRFTGDEPIFAVTSHRGVDPGVMEGLSVGRQKSASEEVQ